MAERVVARTHGDHGLYHRQSTIVENADPEARLSGFDSCLCHILVLSRQVT